MGSMTEDADIKWLMENGYVQKLEDGKKLWIKATEASE